MCSIKQDKESISFMSKHYNTATYPVSCMRQERRVDTRKRWSSGEGTGWKERRSRGGRGGGGRGGESEGGGGLDSDSKPVFWLANALTAMPGLLYKCSTSNPQGAISNI